MTYRQIPDFLFSNSPERNTNTSEQYPVLLQQTNYDKQYYAWSDNKEISVTRVAAPLSLFST